MSVLANRIGGDHVVSDATFEVRSPYSDELEVVVSAAGDYEVDTALHLARSMRQPMGELPRYERSRLLNGLADLVARDAEQLAAFLVGDVGKPIRDSRVEVARAEEVLRLTASAVLQTEGTIVPMDAVPSGASKLGFEVRVPAGVVVAIAPFNAPLNLGLSKVAAALAAGCPCIVKSPPQGPRAITHVIDLVQEAGWPAGAVSVLHGGSEPGQRLVGSDIPRVVSFTGSAPAGRQIARTAGLKRLVLELGSNAPTVLCEDADVADAVDRLPKGAYSSAGQACISTQRILVHRSIYQEVVDGLLAATAELKVGDPASEETDVGPVIDDGAVERAREWVQAATAGGARLLTSEVEPMGPAGRVLAPILLADVPGDSKLCTDEVFAPLAMVQAFDTDEEAIEVANATPYGLQAGVFTESIERALLYARTMEFGGVQINETSRVRLDLHSFGGMKESGIGREGVKHAIDAMSELRFVGLRSKSTR